MKNKRRLLPSFRFNSSKKKVIHDEDVEWWQQSIYDSMSIDAEFVHNLENDLERNMDAYAGDTDHRHDHATWDVECGNIITISNNNNNSGSNSGSRSRSSNNINLEKDEDANECDDASEATEGGTLDTYTVWSEYTGGTHSTWDGYSRLDGEEDEEDDTTLKDVSCHDLSSLISDYVVILQGCAGKE